MLTIRARRPDVTQPATNVAPPVPQWDDTDPMVDQARKIAGQDATILISGEPGVGKSRMARIIHDFSLRRKEPFVTLRCGSIAAEAFATELYGESDSTDRPGGKLGEAWGGTLVLDDVNGLPKSCQASLLAWIEEEAREAAFGRRRPGRPRIIATSRVNLADETSEGRFRYDLFYRLNVIAVDLAPLRRRRLEIGAIAAEFLSESGGPGSSFAPETLLALESHGWPRNIRELRETVESVVAKARGPILGRELLPDTIRSAIPAVDSGATGLDAPPRGAVSSTLAQTKRDAEYARITQALEKHNHNRLRTAGELGISRMTLYKKLYQYGIIEQEDRDGIRLSGRSRRPSPSGYFPGPLSR